MVCLCTYNNNYSYYAPATNNIVSEIDAATSSAKSLVLLSKQPTNQLPSHFQPCAPSNQLPSHNHPPLNQLPSDAPLNEKKKRLKPALVNNCTSIFYTEPFHCSNIDRTENIQGDITVETEMECDSTSTDVMEEVVIGDAFGSDDELYDSEIELNSMASSSDSVHSLGVSFVQKNLSMVEKCVANTLAMLLKQRNKINTVVMFKNTFQSKSKMKLYYQ
ncbi:MAG: hypothetical protein IIC67_01450 [Thaumarchaeota archaeon]|nr:hypothetical protein [Nitrososphaerota archaeon]